MNRDESLAGAAGGAHLRWSNAATRSGNTMRRLILCLSTALLAAAGTRALAAETIRPGYWESVNIVGFPVNSTKTDRRCITAKDVERFVQGPRNHIYDCQYPEHSAAGGQISFNGRCVDKKGFSVKISGHGEYTETTLKMSALVKVGPLAVEASTDAHRLGDACPAGAPGA
jgi:hypothetical protein